MFGKIIIKISIVILFATLFVTSCSDYITNSTPSIADNNSMLIMPKFTEIQTKVFNKTCATTGCHNTGGVAPDLSGNSYLNIVNKLGSTGIPYIKPNEPNKSYLYLKVIGDASIQGQKMPLNSSPLSSATLDAFRKWIEDGAKNN